MRILLVNKFHYRKGGSETYYFAVADALRRMGHEVHFFAMEDEKNLPCDDADLFVPNRDYNGPTSPVAKASAAVSIIYSSEARKRFQGLCERVRPDVVHMNLVHRQITLSILDAPYLSDHRVPVVWTAHDYIAVCPSYTMLDGAGSVCDACLGGHFLSCAKRRCVKGSAAKSLLAAAEARFLRWSRSYEKIDRIICPSRFLKEKMREGGFPESQLLWLPNFIPDEAMGEIERCGASKADVPYFLFFGRLSGEKGVDVLVSAFASAAAGLPPDWRLKIVGSGPIEEDLRRIASESGISDRIDFLGVRTGADLRALVKGARWSVAPSTCRENMPYSIVESFAAGTPVIGSDIGGIPDLITGGETGFVFPAGDEEPLARTLVAASAVASEHYEQMRRACEEFVRSRCSQAKHMKELLGLYEELITSKKEGH